MNWEHRGALQLLGWLKVANDFPKQQDSNKFNLFESFSAICASVKNRSRASQSLSLIKYLSEVKSMKQEENNRQRACYWVHLELITSSVQTEWTRAGYFRQLVLSIHSFIDTISHLVVNHFMAFTTTTQTCGNNTQTSQPKKWRQVLTESLTVFLRQGYFIILFLNCHWFHNCWLKIY